MAVIRADIGVVFSDRIGVVPETVLGVTVVLTVNAGVVFGVVTGVVLGVVLDVPFGVTQGVEGRDLIAGDFILELTRTQNGLEVVDKTSDFGVTGVETATRDFEALWMEEVDPFASALDLDTSSSSSAACAAASAAALTRASTASPSESRSACVISLASFVASSVPPGMS